MEGESGRHGASDAASTDLQNRVGHDVQLEAGIWQAQTPNRRLSGHWHKDLVYLAQNRGRPHER